MKRGFTLLELLIVIALIGILVTVGVTSYSTVQKKTRDSRRKADVKAIQNAMEQYYADNGSYPATQDTTCTPNGAVVYMPNGLPLDPKDDGATWRYWVSCNTVAATGISRYCVCAHMEDTAQGNATTTGVGSSGTCAYATSGTYFCAQNLQ